jgi:hypothetical protein
MYKGKTLFHWFHGNSLTVGGGRVNKILPVFSARPDGRSMGGERRFELAPRPVKDKVALFSASGPK